MNKTNKYKNLATNTAIFAIGTFGQKILAFFLIRLYTGYLSAEQFGISENVIATANFLIPIITFSIADSIIRFGLSKEYTKPQILSTGVFTVMIGTVILAAFTPLLSRVDFLRGNVFILFVYVYCSSMRSVSSQFVRSRGLVKLFACDGIFATLMLFVFNLIFLVGLNMGIMGYLLSMILSDVFSTLFLFFFAGLGNFIDFSELSWRVMKGMLKFSLPLIPTTVMWIATTYMDRMFVTSILGMSENGLYSVAHKVPNLLAMVSTMFYQAWSMSAITERKSKDISRFYTKVFSAYQSILFIGTAMIILLIKPLTRIIVDERFFGSYKYVPFLATAVLMMCFAQFLSSIYSTTKHTTNSFVSSLIAAVINLVLNSVLIPKYGVQGAALATLTSYLVCYIIRIVDARRYIYFQVNHSKTIINIIILIGMSIVVITEVKGGGILLVIGAVLITAANFAALLNTVKQILSKRGR